MRKIRVNIFFLAFVILGHLIWADPIFAATAAPPSGYPLGISTKTNLTAGGTLYFNTDQLQEKQIVGQFLARNVTSTGSSGLAKSAFQNYQNAQNNWTLDQLDPAVVSEKISGEDLIRWYANDNSFRYTNKEQLHYYIEEAPTENELTEALKYYPDLKQNFSERLYQDSVQTFPSFVDNGVSNFSQIAENIQSVSDYYAELTDSNQRMVFNSAVQTAEINTERKVVNPNDWGSQSTIQINVALKKEAKEQAVIIVDVDGQIDHFERAQDISINYTNYDPETMLTPYLILNYKHFPTFNFSGSTFFHATAYPSLPGDEEYKFEGNQGIFFEGKYADKEIPLVKSDSHTIPADLKERTYKVATHLVHNFNDEEQEIQFRSNASLFIGTVFAPRASVFLDDTQGKVLGSVISGRDIHTNMSISAEESDATFDYNDFPDFGDIVGGEELEAPIKTGSRFDYMGSEKKLLYRISQKIPAYSQQKPIQNMEIIDQLAPELVVSVQDIVIKDELGTNVTNRFTINKNEANELRISANSESLDDSRFYGQTYTVDLIGSVQIAQEILADLTSDKFLIPNTATVTLNQEEKTSNEALLEADLVQGKPVTVKYVNEDGQEIAPETTIIGRIGKNYQTKAESISGYTLIRQPENDSGTISNEEQTVIYRYQGQLAFSSVPAQLSFGTHELSAENKEYAIESMDQDIIIKDTRTLGSNWQLRATLDKPLTGERTQAVLPDALVYTDGSQTQTLHANTSTVIHSAVTTTHDECNVSQGWTASERGLKVNVKSGEARADRYSGEIRWELYDVVANE
ncbi:MucBP domain-containing protein [Enterococcus wangshanyuanii]|uniref:MucBP domain-containing protein n=1 Tax=Enterococcus wangshanyuanii TaxID=2005703 RepID=UPI000B4AC0BA|nr:MucBP domain-containing protein [Enterococcus wangshanyuanii]